MVFVPASTVSIFREVACDMLSINSVVSEERVNLKMRSCFGVGLNVCNLLWNALRIDRLFPAKTQYKHLLWALAFLKSGSTEEQLSVVFQCDVKTLRKWVWDVILSISRYDSVSKNYFYIY